MDKSVFYTFRPEEEINQGTAYILLESFKIRICINVINGNPEVAAEFFNKTWEELGIHLQRKKLFKELCIFFWNHLKSEYV